MDASTITGLFTLSGAVVGGLAGVAGKAFADLIQARRDRETRREQQRHLVRRSRKPDDSVNSP